MRRAVTTGARRAGFHFLRAGYEVVAGAGAFLDEVIRARKTDDERPGEAMPPTRVTVE
jgi:hypothetical protein